MYEFLNKHTKTTGYEYTVVIIHENIYKPFQAGQIPSFHYRLITIVNMNTEEKTDCVKTTFSIMLVAFLQKKRTVLI